METHSKPEEGWVIELRKLKPRAAASFGGGEALRSLIDAALGLCAVAQTLRDHRSDAEGLAKRNAFTTLKIVEECIGMQEGERRRKIAAIEGATSAMLAATEDLTRTRKLQAKTLDPPSPNARARLRIDIGGNLGVYRSPFKALERSIEDAARLALMREGASVSAAHAAREEARRRDLYALLKPALDAQYNATVAPPGCLRDTRVALLKKIEKWATSAVERIVFWLSGLAGTGKSAIVRTICERLDSKGLLLACFFISRNSVERRKPEAVLHTLIHHCARRLPDFAEHIHKVITRHPETLSLSIPDQVARLFVEPLEKVRYSGPPLVIVIDALDECEMKNAREGGELFPALLQAVQRTPFLRLLVTSRADVLRQLQSHRTVRLQDMDLTIVAQDIRLYLHTEFRKIALRRGLPFNWASDADIEAIVIHAGRLFVYAATVVRFLNHDVLDPVARLHSILHPDDTASPSRFALADRLYKQILESVVGPDDDERETTEALLRTVLGALVVLEVPLSMHGIAKLTGRSQAEVRTIISHLAPVLYYSETEPIRLFHASFPDFVLDRERCPDPRFHIDAAQYHAFLAERCFLVMNGNLRQDICGIRDVSLRNSQVPDLKQKLIINVGEEVQYACAYWFKHLSASNSISEGLDAALESFSRHHLFHWIEVLSLLEHIPATLVGLPKAIGWCKTHSRLGSHTTLLGDALRVIHLFQTPITTSALQVYLTVPNLMPNCALYHQAATESRLGRLLSPRRPSWPPLLHEMQGHTGFVRCLSFLPDGVHLVSCSEDKTIRVWNTSTAECVSTLVGHESEIVTLACGSSPRTIGACVVSGSTDNTVRVWDVEMAEQIAVLRGHSSTVYCVALSADGKLVASGSWYDRTVRLWEVETESVLQVFPGWTAQALAFSPDGISIASAGYPSACLRDLHNSTAATLNLGACSSLAFSRDGSHIAVGLDDGTITVQDFRVKRRTIIHRSKSKLAMAIVKPVTDRIHARGTHKHAGPVTHVQFLDKDNTQVLSTSLDGTIRTWNTTTHESVEICRAPVSSQGVHPTPFVLYPSMSRVATGARSGLIQVWDTALLQEHHAGASPPGHGGPITSIRFSRDGKQIASGSSDKTVRLWTAATGECVATLNQSAEVTVVEFSPDGGRLASGDACGRVRVWSTSTKKCLATLVSNVAEADEVRLLAFSGFGTRLAAAVNGPAASAFVLWDLTTKTRVASLETTARLTPSLRMAVSPDARLLATDSDASGTRVWSVGTGECVADFSHPTRAPEGRRPHAGTWMLEFSADGNSLLRGSRDGAVHAFRCAPDGAWSETKVPKGQAGETPPDAYFFWQLLSVADGQADGWLYFCRRDRRKRVFWLPRAYRTGTYHWCGGVVAIAGTDGSLLVLDLADSVSLPSSNRKPTPHVRIATAADWHRRMDIRNIT